MYGRNVGKAVTSGVGPVTPIKVAWASVAASATNPYQLVGFSGGTSAHACTVQVFFGSTVVLSYYSKASGHAVSEFFGEDGPITATNEKLAIKTTAVIAGEPCYANLLYRIVL